MNAIFEHDTATSVCRHGTMAYLRHDIYIGRSLALYGEYSEDEVRFLLNLIGPADVVIEVGANIGAITVPLAQGAARVHAFEPQARCLAILKQNLEQNRETTVEVSGAAIGAACGTITVPRLRYDEENNFGGVSLLADGADGDVVPLATLDSLGFSACRLLKIDVEGMETDVLEGARETIAACRPFIYCEFLDNREKIFGLLSELGYVVWEHNPPLYAPDNFNRYPHNVFGDVVSVNVLAVPREMDLVPTDERGQPLQKIRSVTPPAPAIRTKGWAAVCRFGGVGDNLIVSTVFRQMREKHGRLEVITQAPYHVVYENNPYIDKLAVYDEGDLPKNETDWQGWFRTRSKEYDQLINLSHSLECLISIFPGNSAYWWPASFRRQMCDRNFLEVVHDICEVPREPDPRFFPTDEERDRALKTRRLMGDTVIGWCISGTRLDKIYPRMSLVVPRLIKECGAQVVIFGKPGPDADRATQVREHVERVNGSHAGFHIAISQDPENKTEYQSWPIRRVLTQLQTCDLVIGPDTGPMWAVAMEAMPKLVMLSHASPKNVTLHWKNTVTLHANQARVPCWPCHRLIDSPDQCVPNADNTGAACISDITPERIVSAARLLLTTE